MFLPILPILIYLPVVLLNTNKIINFKKYLPSKRQHYLLTQGIAMLFYSVAKSIYNFHCVDEPIIHKILVLFVLL